MIRILVADDHEVVRRGLTMVLRLEPGFEVVGEARNGAEAVQLTRAACPDILLLDLKMPVMDGATAAPLVREQCPDTRLILLSGAEIDETLVNLLGQVDGYVPKDVSPAELAHAIRTVAEGRPYLHVAVAQALKERLTQAPSIRAPLSAREMEVLQWLASAATYREIGHKLFISEETVRSHVKNILAKLEQPNRAQAVMAALRLGWLKLD